MKGGCLMRDERDRAEASLGRREEVQGESRGRPEQNFLVLRVRLAVWPSLPLFALSTPDRDALAMLGALVRRLVSMLKLRY